MNLEHLKAIYPTLSDEELKQADENLCRYFACALEIAKEANGATVDKPAQRATIEERSHSSSNKDSV